MNYMDAPFPWFGGKRRVAGEVWRRFGDVPKFVEPFFGSGAMLLGRPASHKGTTETVNDLDGYVANFWRALQHEPGAVAQWADNPVNENDLHARHLWLIGQRETLTARLEGDPDYYDAKIAGWWAWGICCWIGGGWCSGVGPWHSVDGLMLRTENAGQGVNRKLPHLGDAGRGVNRQCPHLSNAGRGVNRQQHDGLQAWFAALASRLRHVRVCSGDWSRVCTPAVTHGHGLTGVFLDPPYSHEERDGDLYRVEMPVATAVRDWAVANGDNPLMRIALCGYEGEHEMPESWSVHEWKAAGGYAAQDNTNGERERIWFSPHCLPLTRHQQRLFEEDEE